MSSLGFVTFSVLGLAFRLTTLQFDIGLGLIVELCTGSIYWLLIASLSTRRPMEWSPFYVYSSRFQSSDMLYKFQMCIVFLGSEIISTVS